MRSAQLVLTLASTFVLAACGDSGARETAATDPTDPTVGATPATVGSITATDGLTDGDPTQSGTGDLTTGTGGASHATTGDPTSPSDPTSDSGPKFDLGATPDGGSMGCGDSGGDADTMYSYIWIANSGEGTVSKIKTLPAANCGVYGRIQAVG